MSIDLVVLIAVLAGVITGLFYLLTVYILDRSVKNCSSHFTRYNSFLIITVII